jgi:hypothetical protein
MATANLQMALQQQQAALQMAQSGMLPGAGALPPQQAAAMAQAAALMGMNTADASMQAAAGLQGFNMMPPMMPDASAAGEAAVWLGTNAVHVFVVPACMHTGLRQALKHAQPVLFCWWQADTSWIDFCMLIVALPALTFVC